MRKSKRSLHLHLSRETVRILQGAELVGVRGGEINLSYAPGCLSTSYHGTVCNSGQQSCNPVDCTVSTSG